MLTVAVALMVKAEHQAKTVTKAEGGAVVQASSRKLFLHLDATLPFLSTMIPKNNRLSWVTNKLESRFLGEIRATSDMQTKYIFEYIHACTILLSVTLSVRSKAAWKEDSQK